jgi:FkbM family methyltransferase
MKIKAYLQNLKWRFHNLGYQKTNFGTKLKINSFMDHLVYKEIFIDKIYDSFILHAFNNISDKNGSIRIFDLGANIGFFTVRCCEIWKQIQIGSRLDFVIYEPSENCIGSLKENLKVFDQSTVSFDIRNKLVGKKTGWDWFIEDKDHHLGQCISDEIEKSGNRYSRKINYHNLSQDLSLSKIDLLKCDIEGNEVEFLKNYKSYLKKVSSIIIETHGKAAKDFTLKTMKEINFENIQTLQSEDDLIFSNLFFENSLLSSFYSVNK